MRKLVQHFNLGAIIRIVIGLISMQAVVGYAHDVTDCVLVETEATIGANLDAHIKKLQDWQSLLKVEQNKKPEAFTDQQISAIRLRELGLDRISGRQAAIDIYKHRLWWLEKRLKIEIRRKLAEKTTSGPVMEAAQADSMDKLARIVPDDYALVDISPVDVRSLLKTAAELTGRRETFTEDQVSAVIQIHALDRLQHQIQSSVSPNFRARYFELHNPYTWKQVDEIVQILSRWDSPEARHLITLSERSDKQDFFDGVKAFKERLEAEDRSYNEAKAQQIKDIQVIRRSVLATLPFKVPVNNLKIAAQDKLVAYFNWPAGRDELAPTCCGKGCGFGCPYLVGNRIKTLWSGTRSVTSVISKVIPALRGDGLALYDAQDSLRDILPTKAFGLPTRHPNSYKGFAGTD